MTTWAAISRDLGLSTSVLHRFCKLLPQKQNVAQTTRYHKRIILELTDIVYSSKHYEAYHNILQYMRTHQLIDDDEAMHTFIEHLCGFHESEHKGTEPDVIDLYEVTSMEFIQEVNEGRYEVDHCGIHIEEIFR